MTGVGGSSEPQHRTAPFATAQLVFVPSATAVAPLSITSGQLTLKGNGTVTLAADHAELRASLNGALPCKDVARSAAVTNLGGVLGGLLGSVAEVAMQGNLLIGVRVEADSRQPGQASFTPTITARCGPAL